MRPTRGKAEVRAGYADQLPRMDVRDRGGKNREIGPADRARVGEVPDAGFSIDQEVQRRMMIRDVRTLHRGTPNRGTAPRPMAVIGYNRAAHSRPQLRITIPKTTYQTLSPRARNLLRLNPVVEELTEAMVEEPYSDLYFLKE
jgi:hypothetical protein